MNIECLSFTTLAKLRWLGATALGQQADMWLATVRPNPSLYGETSHILRTLSEMLLIAIGDEK